MSPREATATLLSAEEFARCFSECRFTAFRLETLQVYDVGYEQEGYRRFLEDGTVVTTADHEEWAALVGSHREFRRVHVVTEPLTDYLRFECAWAYRSSVEAGEDVNILPVADGEWPEGIPHFDYWLFDSHKLVRMNYVPETGAMLAPELVTDPERIVEANAVRDRALHMAVSFRDFQRRFDQAMRPLT